jgi:hypothetical protein
MADKMGLSGNSDQIGTNLDADWWATGHHPSYFDQNTY